MTEPVDRPWNSEGKPNEPHLSPEQIRQAEEEQLKRNMAEYELQKARTKRYGFGCLAVVLVPIIIFVGIDIWEAINPDPCQAAANAYQRSFDLANEGDWDAGSVEYREALVQKDKCG